MRRWPVRFSCTNKKTNGEMLIDTAYLHTSLKFARLTECVYAKGQIYELAVLPIY